MECFVRLRSGLSGSSKVWQGRKVRQLRPGEVWHGRFRYGEDG